MPPKRATRATARTGSTPARRRQAREPSSELDLAGPTVMQNTTPNPAKYSTNYGSPATIMPVRRPGTYGTNLAGAFGNVLEKVRQDNADDEQARIQREAEEGGRKQDSSPIVEESSLPENPSSEPDLPSGAGSNQGSSDVSRAPTSEPAAPSDPPAAPSNDGAGSTPFPGRRQTRASVRAGSVQPVNTPSLRPGRSNRLQSEPIHSDAPTVKSYVEESGVFNKANVNTPVVPSSAASQQQERKDSVEPTPSRRSSRTAANTTTSGVQNPPVPANRRKLLDRIEERSKQLSEKIDEQPEKEAEAEASTKPTTNSSHTTGNPLLKPLPGLAPVRRRPGFGSLFGRLPDQSKPSDSASEEEEEEEDVDDINGKDPITTIRNNGATRRPPRPSSIFTVTPIAAGAANRASREPTADPDRAARQRLADEREIQETRAMMQAAHATMDKIKRDKAQRASQSPLVDEAADHRRPNSVQKPASLAFQRQNDQPVQRRHTPTASPERESSVENNRDSPSPNRPRHHRTSTAGLNKPGKLDAFKALLRWLGGLTLIFIATRLVFFYTLPEEAYAGVRVNPYKPQWSRNPFHSIVAAIPWSVLHPLGCLSDNEYRAWGERMLQDYHLLEDHNRRIEAQHQQLEKLSKFLPKVVQMELGKDGKPKIPQDFWHALRGLIQEDSMILTLEKLKNGNSEISDYAWYAIKHRIQAEKLDLSGGNQKSNITALSVVDVEHITERTMSKSWETWVKQVEGNLENRLGSGVEERVLARMDEVLKDKLRDRATQEVPVPRDQFMQILYDEFSKHDKKIRTDLGEMETRLNAAIGDMQAAAHDSRHPGGFTREQVKGLVDDAVRKVWGDAQLEAMAKGKISAHYQDELSTQINVFDMGNHATVDRTRTSRTYQLPKQMKDESWWRRHRGPVVPLDAYAALTPWSGPGDCWCTVAAVKDKSAPADIAIMTGRRLVPQNLVVEHIDAGATIDPDATPRKLEVWAHIDDPVRRRTVEDWMFDIYPETKKDHVLLQDRFVKVGEFTYDRGFGKGGVQVFQMSRELLKMDAQTDHVVVRAVDNYGADHTCFYRLRLYGEITEAAAR